MSALPVMPLGLIRPTRPRVYSILSMPSEVTELWSTFLTKPPTVDGYQTVLTKILREMRQYPLRYSQDLLYNQLALLRYWPAPQQNKGAPKGPRDYADEQTFLSEVIEIKRLFVKKGLTPTQPRVAMYLMERWEERDELLDERSSARHHRQSQSVVRRLQRLCAKHGKRWDELI
jgi:hypothetical protein